MKSWQEYIEHHQSRKRWSNYRLSQEFGVEPITIQKWRAGVEVRQLRLIVRAASLFGKRWLGCGLSEMAWLLTELQEKHEINTNVLYRRGVSKKSYITLRRGGNPTFSIFCEIIQGFRLEEEELKEVFEKIYEITQRRINNEEQ